MTNEYFDQFGIAIEHHDIVIWTDTTYTGKVNSHLGVVTGFTPKLLSMRKEVLVVNILLRQID